jgi:hypothetical protein
MEQRKSLRRRVSHFFNPQQSFSAVTQIQQGAREEKQKEEVPQEVNMLSAPTPLRPSRLHRLSSFLPSINTQSKLQKDVLRKPLPRKQLPSQFEAPPTSAPARLSPAVSAMASEPTIAPLTPAKNRLANSNDRPLSADEYFRTTEKATPPTNRTLLSPQVAQSENVHGRRAVSGPVTSCPAPNQLDGESSSKAISKLRRVSWMPGGKARSKTVSQEERENSYAAWINAGTRKIEYDIQALMSGEKVIRLLPSFLPLTLTQSRYQNSGMSRQTPLYISHLMVMNAGPPSKSTRCFSWARES